MEQNAIDRLVFIGAGYVPNVKPALSLPWVQDAISETEYKIITSLFVMVREMILEQDRMTAADFSASLMAMPFFQVPDTTDVLAIEGMRRLAIEGMLSALVDHSTFQDGLTEDETVLVAAAATLYQNPEEMSRILEPGYAFIETESRATELTPDLKVSIIRTGSHPRPETVDAVANVVDFVERVMQLPLPTDHVIFVLSDEAVPSTLDAANYGFAIGYRPEYEQRQDPFESLLVHEVAHYYWYGSEDWIDEGVAETIQYMYGIEKGLSPGQLRTPRQGCEAHDLEMLSEWDPAINNPQFICHHYLGRLLFQELSERLGSEEFASRMREFYRLALTENDAGRIPEVISVRQVFSDQIDIVDKHWSGGLNAPENRSFDEGLEVDNHGLIQWDQYPSYDGRSVRFRGTLLEDAVLSAPIVHQTIEEYSNFTLSPADGYGSLGSIFPALEGREWALENPGDSIATVYQLDDKAFTVEFPFPEALGNPSDYIVIVWGYKDDSRTPRIYNDIDPLGYARIREE